MINVNGKSLKYLTIDKRQTVALQTVRAVRHCILLLLLKNSCSITSHNDLHFQIQIFTILDI